MTKFQVVDYATGDYLKGAASDALVSRSVGPQFAAGYLASNPEGAVRASLVDGVWVPDQDGTHTVYVQEV